MEQENDPLKTQTEIQGEELSLKTGNAGEEVGLIKLMQSGKSVGEPFCNYPTDAPEFDRLADYCWPHLRS